MKHKFLQFCSTVLALVMLLQILPVAARGAEDTTGDLQASSAQTAGEVCVVSELPQGRGEYQKEFLLSNGNRLAAVYAHAVHYEKDGSWLEIDNTLTLSGEGKNAAYTNAAGPWQVSFPRQLSGSSAVTVTKDGHTLSFAMSGQLLAPTMGEIGNVPALTLSQPGSAVAQLTEQTRTDAAADPQYPEAVAETHDTGLMYSGIFENTDIRYDLTSNRIKESVIIGSHDAALRGYRYTLQTGELVPVLQEDGQIFFLDRNKESPVMVMPAPFLFDDAGEYCYNVDVTLTGGNGSYTLTYLLDETWLADPNRQYPVVLDPVIYSEADVNNIQDVSVYEDTDSIGYQAGVLDWGHNSGYGIMRSFLMYNKLPALSSADTVVHATFQLYKPNNSDFVTTIQFHKVQQPWTSSTMTWENQPDFNPTIEDFGQVQNTGFYQYDLTDIVRGWYEGANTGLVFRAPDEVENTTSTTSYRRQFYSSDYDVGNLAIKPQLFIEFRNSNGLEGYWDYASASAGRAGTGYVNSYTGNLVWVRPDIGFGGNRMPVSISHVYNANDAKENRFGLGFGWRTNFNQLVYHWDEENAYDDYYVWEDGDGTSHYFKKESEGVYKDEDGLELTLQVTSSGRTITDKYGNTSTFDTQGRLIRQSNNQQTQSHITVTYDGTSKRIAKITDGVGRAYNFTYPGGLLSRISYTGTGTDEVSFVSFGYSGSDLTSVTDKDGKSSTYTYTNHLLTSASDIDGYKLTYTYKAPADPTWQPYRVKTVAESDGTAQGGTLSIEYAHNQTTFTDHNGHVQIVQFNNLGNPLSVQDDQGRAQFAGYALDGTEEVGDPVPANAKNNQLAISSKLQNTVSNLIKISDFEDGSVWTRNSTNVTCSATTEVAYKGSRSLKVVRSVFDNRGDACGNSIVASPGETYTFSAYVKTGTATACILLWNGSFSTLSVTLPANTDWTRLEVSYTTTGTETVTPYIFTRSSGTAYIDCAQLEKTETASRYNLITNGDFRFTGSPTYGWSGTGLSSTDIPAAIASAAPQLDNTAFRITGAPSATKKLSQTVKISGAKGDSFVLSGWAKGDSAPLTDDTRKFALKATVNHTDGTKQDFSVSFNPDADSSINWQYAALPIVTEKAYSSITVTLDYSNNVNTAYFDGIQLFKEAFGSSYTYDAKGNVTAVKDIQGGTTAYTYNTAGDLTKQTLPSGSVLTYEYDSKHNVTKATSAEGVVYTLTYDTWGNNLTVSVGSGITTTATYTSDGNRLSTAKDAAGNITTYSYNANTNVLDWVKYPNDTDTTRTNYTYDSMYRLAVASIASNNTAYTATYTYTDDLLTKLQTATTAYHFAYGDFALRSSIQVGSTALASYTYTADRNRYLQQLTYGNQDFVRYAYDSYGRLTGQTYEDGSTVTYAYDNTGALATVTDSASGIKTTYYYDLTDRLIQYAETGTGHSHAVGYVYDRENKLTSLTEKINGTAFTTSYTYDDDNRVSSITDRGITESYTYDAYGRVTQKVTKNGSTTVLTETYTYRTVSGKPTGQIATHKSVSSGRTVTYTYNYDANGNITSVSDGTHTTTYVYDSANQLTRENNQADGVTRTFTYDRAGNITAWTEYAYTTGTLGAATATHGYTYGNSNWGDQLTAWNGNTITSDTIGNMLSDGTRTYTWRNGRELATVTKGGVTWTNTYNADGIRTKRTNGTNTYSYIYNGGSLSQMTVDGTVMNFAYDASGTPMAVTYGGATYYYATNIQGDVVAILNSSGTAVVTYTYDAWGNILTTTGTLASTLGTHNPLRYRGYVYDPETGLYYLQSRYYNPEMGRFICADSLVSTGQGILGNNMFAYCLNNPVNLVDYDGKEPITISVSIVVLGVVVLVLVVDLGAQALSDILSWIYTQYQYAYANIEFIAKNETDQAAETKKQHSLPVSGAPNSDDELEDDDGTIKQKRHYGPDGRAEYDIDYKHPGKHKFPHKHIWDWDTSPPRSEALPID